MLPLLLLLLFLLLPFSHPQQLYENNAQLACYATNSSSTLGYTCNGASTSCTTYLTFRASETYRSPVDIAYLLSSDASNISTLNGIPDTSQFPIDQLVLVPVNCSCSGSGSGSGAYYQHNASYILKFLSETYFVVANNTYQGLTACQALMAQNSVDSLNLTVGLTLNVPVRCACPTASQVASGVKYLLTYPVRFGDDVPTIASRFGADYDAVLNANNLSSTANIYPYTTLLVPLNKEPTKDELVSAPPPPPPPPPPAQPTGGGSNKKWVYVGVGIGIVGALCIGILVWFLFFRRRSTQSDRAHESDYKIAGTYPSTSTQEYSDASDKIRGQAVAISIQNIREAVESLKVYGFHELAKATGDFDEEHHILGSVYRAVINGDTAAVKRLKGDVSKEISILKQINHANVVRLSGFCLHNGSTYLVYEFAERGSLKDWLHQTKNDDSTGRAVVSCLSWKERVQIAQDVANGLNYLHNYANPSYVHQNVKSSNILLDSEFRAKVANFGLARAVNEGEDPQLTRHVVGTQGYMAPEYLEHGLITPKLDVFAFGVVMLELLSGKEAAYAIEGEKKESLLWTTIESVMGGEDVRSKLKNFIDPYLGSDYPFDLAFTMAELAMRCVARDPATRPSIADVFASLSAIYNASLDWDPSDYTSSNSMVYGM